MNLQCEGKFDFHNWLSKFNTFHFVLNLIEKIDSNGRLLGKIEPRNHFPGHPRKWLLGYVDDCHANPYNFPSH